MVVRHVLEDLQARNLRSIDVHVVDFWLLNALQVLLLGHLLLEHFVLFLVLLNTSVDTMHKNVSVDNLFLGESVRCLLVAEATCTGSGGNCSLRLLDNLNLLRLRLRRLSGGWNIENGRVDAHFRFLLLLGG